MNKLRDTSLGAYLLYGAALVYVMTLASILRGPLGMHETVIVYEVAGVLGAGLVYRRLMGDWSAPAPELRTAGGSAGALVVAVLAAVALGLWANVSMVLTVELAADAVPGVRELAERYQQQVEILILEAEGVERVLGIVGVCVAAPLCEEGLFRGVMLSEQRKSEGWFAAALLNGAMFGAFHLNPLSLVPLTVVGLFLAHLTIRSGSLWPAILAHAALNISNGVVMPALLPASAKTTGVGEMTLFEGGYALTIESVGQYAVLLLLFGGLAAWLWWLAVGMLSEDRSGG
ncbi:MAG: lysostaphin resistance A-like protein [Bradymonadaceae bacterium]